MLTISVLETPAPIAPGGIAGNVAVVIDVLRATSSIATAISSGCRAVIPAGSRDEALCLRATHPEALLGGEIGGKKIDGFDLGNSPADFTRQAVEGREVIMSTSNGTKAILAARKGGANPIFTSSFLNLRAVARRVWAEMSAGKKDLTVVCSGSLGRPSLEDFSCAGALAEAVLDLAGARSPALDDTAKRAVQVFQNYKGNIIGIFEASPHGRDLQEMGFGEDLRRCASLDSLDVVPVFNGTAIVALSQR
jgi:2-phosphosulfolactate phosphatase